MKEDEMSEKCVHEWYYRIVDICSWQFFCIRCGEKLSMDKFSDHASDLEKRMAELEAERRWIPVSERLPEVGEEVFVCDESGHRRVDWLVCKPIDGVGETLFYSEAYDDDPPTHWMPLPELPEVQE